jgi:hypothetical protein
MLRTFGVCGVYVEFGGPVLDGDCYMQLDLRHAWQLMLVLLNGPLSMGTWWDEVHH